MKRRFLYLSVLITFFLLSCQLRAGNDIWDPITQADWSVTPDTSLGIRDAVMLFEKITFDDRRLDKGRATITIYRRIRILNREGREWGDVTIPYIHKKQKIEKIRGRTVLRDGSEFKLEKQNIIQFTRFKSKGIKVKQYSFSLPGITDDCILEYFFKYRIPHPYGLWGIQKEIPLLYGELRWKFFLLPDIPGVTLSLSLERELDDWVSTSLTPNYLSRPPNLPMRVQVLPSPEQPEEVVFTIKNVVSFKPESFTLPDISLQARLLCYYGGNDNPQEHWKETSEKTYESIEKFCKKNKRLRKVIASFTNLNLKEGKIKTAYNWCQQNIENITYLESDKKSKKNKNVDDVVKNRYGTQGQINNVFFEMLRQMGFNPKMAFAVDRDENIFVSDAKYWQFHRRLVAVADENGLRYYSPGDLYLKPGEIPWVNEGTKAFMTGNTVDPFQVLPFSDWKENRIYRKLNGVINDQGQIVGDLYEERRGHQARAIRLFLAQNNATEQRRLLKTEWEDAFRNAAVDSVSFENLEELKMPLKISGKMEFYQPLTEVGTRKLLKPFDYFEETTNPFQAELRKFPLMFDYGYEQLEILQVDVPENWSIQIPGKDTPFANEIGYSAVTCTIIGKSLLVQHLFRLNQPFWIAEKYPEVQELFQARQALRNLTIVLNENTAAAK